MAKELRDKGTRPKQRNTQREETKVVTRRRLHIAVTQTKRKGLRGSKRRIGQRKTKNQGRR
jgi:hypothetical protein